MPPPRIVEAIDVLEDGQFCFPAGWPRPPSDQLGLDRPEERLDSGVVIAIAFARHGHPEAVLTQKLLIAVRALLRPAIRKVDTVFRRLPQHDRHLQGPDRQVTLHAITDSPADYAL